MTKRTAPDIDERAILESLRPEGSNTKSLQFAMEGIIPTEASTLTTPNESSVQSVLTEATDPIETFALSHDVSPIVSEKHDRTNMTTGRISTKQKKATLEEYQRTFLRVPKTENRKPVFVSCEVRDRLDEIVRRLGGRRMSVSGLIENLARHHLETYGDDIEQWRKL